jgi:DNA-binding NarL/FixJ family response regulator
MPFSELVRAMEALGAPALIVGTGGEVLHANANGRSLFDDDRKGIRQSLARTAAGEPNSGPWQLIPLVGPAERQQFLAIRSADPRPAPTPALSVQEASVRWRLTTRQAEVLDLVARGMTNATIAAALQIAIATVEFHVSRIFDKAGVENRASLVASLLGPV